MTTAIDLTLWVLLGAFLLVGLYVYERKGRRLGGVLVLPLLIIYALVDLVAIVVFGLAAVVALIAGHVAYDRTLLYGRRLLVVFLIIGLAATAVIALALPLGAHAFMFALLPGLFAYNLHREGDQVEAATSFMLWLAGLLALASVWLAATSGGRTGVDPVTSVQSLGGPGVFAVPGLQEAWQVLAVALQTVADALHAAGRALWDALRSLGLPGVAAASAGGPDPAGVQDAVLGTGTSGAAFHEAMKGGAAE